jgi:hypothetical protein
VVVDTGGSGAATADTVTATTTATALSWTTRNLLALLATYQFPLGDNGDLSIRPQQQTVRLINLRGKIAQFILRLFLAKNR